MVEPVCLRCGRCCWYIKRKTGTVVPCKHLVKVGSKTMCRSFKSRNMHLRDGKTFMIAEDQRCVYRKDSKFDYEGCPYNTGKPMFNGG